jgi:hypothetical protein
MTPNSHIPDMFGEPREKGVSEWQTFNAVRRDSGAYTVSAFRTPKPTSAPSIVRYGASRLLILKKAAA